jgi:Nickel-dependent hydrogenase
VRSQAGINRNEGVGVAEAPRGTLIHHYRVDDHGIVQWANLLIATGHNNLAMNKSVLEVARHYVRGEALDEAMLNRVEAVIRCYDPCLSCSTHAIGQMPLRVELVAHDGAVLAELRRRGPGCPGRRLRQHAARRRHRLAGGRPYGRGPSAGRRRGVRPPPAHPRAGPGRRPGVAGRAGRRAHRRRPPGSIRGRRVTPRGDGVAAWSHHLDPAALAGLAGSLYGAVPPVYLVSVAGVSFDHGEELSPALQHALPRVADTVAHLAAEPDRA